MSGQAGFALTAGRQALSTARGLAFTLIASEGLRAAGLSNAFQSFITGTLSGLAVGGVAGAAIGGLAGSISAIYALVQESNAKSEALQNQINGLLEVQRNIKADVQRILEEQERQREILRGREFLRVGRIETELFRKLEKELFRLKSIREGA